MVKTLLVKMKRLIKILLLICIALFIVSIFQKDRLPKKEEILDKLYQEPTQTETTAIQFNTKVGGITYTITTLYDYELYGLIVSYHHSTSWWDYYHERWGDFLNLKDICVIWGDNIKTEVYKEMEFSSGSWTCYPKFKRGINQELASSFKNNSGSNNHLLSDNEEINKEIMKAKKGDQIFMKGHLVKYFLADGSFERGTSTSRGDTGSGACETIFLTDFQILKTANQLWRSIFTFTKYAIPCCFAFLVILFFKTPILKPRKK